MSRARRTLPGSFLEFLPELETAYLAETDPILQSGFHGGPDRWRAERSPLLDAVDRSGSLLDVGCANGYLLACCVEWARERGLEIEPFGIDSGAGLVSLARSRFPDRTAHFWVANAWDWLPPRRFDFVYMIWDVVPDDYRAELVDRLRREALAPDGRLIVGAYGSRSRHESPLDIGEFLREAGFEVLGESRGGDPLLTRFAWVGAP